MGATVLILIFSIAAVAIFVIGMSLTLMIKGHHIRSEIGENEHMRSLGIKCAMQQCIDEERALAGEDGCGLPPGCTDQGCLSCTKAQ